MYRDFYGIHNYVQERGRKGGLNCACVYKVEHIYLEKWEEGWLKNKFLLNLHFELSTTSRLSFNHTLFDSYLISHVDLG